jgi:hypothetical protein
MSGLFARTKSAGRDGVRDARSKHIGDIDDASVIYGSSCVSTDRSFHLLRPASSWAIRRATSLAAPISDQVGIAVTGRLYTPPDIIKRQAMRANLLARATATNFGGFRSNSAASQGMGL